MQALTEKTRIEIYDSIDALDYDHLNESGLHYIKCFSVFDHWLKEDEMQPLVLFYQ